MARREDIDTELRTRLAKWTLWLKKEYGIESDRAFARRVGLAGPTVTNLLNHGKGGGIDYLAALHRAFGKSADTFIDSDPPDPVELPPSHPPPGRGRARTLASPPRSAPSTPRAPGQGKPRGAG